MAYDIPQVSYVPSQTLLRGEFPVLGENLTVDPVLSVGMNERLLMVDNRLEVF